MSAFVGLFEKKFQSISREISADNSISNVKAISSEAMLSGVLDLSIHE
jgi:hypothetical protein